MIFLNRNILSFFFFGIQMMLFGEAFAQKRSIDTLSSYSYTDLHYLILKSKSDSDRKNLYINEYKQRAFRESNIERISNYYRSFVFHQKEEDRLPFVDSALYYAYQINDKTLIANIYLTKGTIYHNIKDYQNTLDNYLKANDYIVQTDDVYNKYRIKNHIGVIKNYLGYYEEAAELLKECVSYFGRDESSYNMHRGYISSLEGLAWSYTKTERITESQQLLAIAFASAEKAGFSDLDIHYTLFKQGINDYFLGMYDSAIYKIEKQLPFLYKNEDFAWASIGEFYIGKSYWNKGDREKAIAYFTKIDALFESRNYTHPDLRAGYELLINYYKAQDDKDKQIKYIGQLVRVDSVFNENHKHLLNRIHKEYTTRDLLTAKRELETALYLQRNKTSLIIVGAVFALLIVLCLMYYRHRKARNIAQALIQKIKTLQDMAAPVVTTHTEAKARAKKASVQLKDDVIELLLANLNDFEQSQKFLESGLTLEKLADSFGTNTTYLSTVINTYKKQTFLEYLNTFRIDYVINEIVKNKDSILFKYSIDSLAKHVGYNSANVFSRAFQARTGVKPSVFIKEVKKNNVLLAS